MHWATNDATVVTVSSWGEVSAVAPGHTLVRVQAGSGRATVAVEVREGHRRRQSDLEFDLEHAGDCNDPEGTEPETPQSAQSQRAIDKDTEEPKLSSAALIDDAVTADSPGLAERARPAMLNVPRSNSNNATTNAAEPRVIAARPAAATKKLFGRGFNFVNDGIDGGSNGDPVAAAATAPYNIVGDPRLAPKEDSQLGATKTKNALGSYNYSISAPVLSLGGRGISTDLALVYNSRLWDVEGSNINFNFNKGWPAAGWSLGYGRMLDNYDGTATGDKTGIGQANRPGNFLLILPDGSRIHLEQSYDSASDRWFHNSMDGTYLQYNPVNGKL